MVKLAQFLCWDNLIKATGYKVGGAIVNRMLLAIQSKQSWWKFIWITVQRQQAPSIGLQLLVTVTSELQIQLLQCIFENSYHLRIAHVSKTQKTHPKNIFITHVSLISHFFLQSTPLVEKRVLHIQTLSPKHLQLLTQKFKQVT